MAKPDHPLTSFCPEALRRAAGRMLHARRRCLSRGFLALMLAATWGGHARGSVTLAPKAGDPPALNYGIVRQNINEATFAVITYFDGTTAIVSDTAWLDQLKLLISSASGQPDSYCFCINYPTVTFANKDREIASLEVAHGRKLRFGGGVSGDFIVDEKIAKQVVTLLMARHDRAMSFAKSQLLPPPPKKLEVDLPPGRPPPPKRG